VKDKSGREVPDAGNLIHFRVQGDARIVGVGNGDPSSHEADQCAPGAWQRSLFNGKCQVIIQSGKTAGAIRLNATSDGLRPAVATLQATDTK
jgi:beta-galactosidase